MRLVSKLSHLELKPVEVPDPVEEDLIFAWKKTFTGISFCTSSTLGQVFQDVVNGGLLVMGGRGTASNFVEEQM